MKPHPKVGVVIFIGSLHDSVDNIFRITTFFDIFSTAFTSGECNLFEALSKLIQTFFGVFDHTVILKVP